MLIDGVNSNQGELEMRSFLDLKEGHRKSVIIVQKPVAVSEKELVEASEAAYHRLNFTDHLRPRREMVDLFLQVVRGIPLGEWIHFHCAGGRGRTTTAMVMYDMLINAKNISADDIMDRQIAFGHEYKLKELDPNKPYKKNYHEDRLDFLYEFYGFAQQHGIASTKLWSEWREESIDND